MASHSIRTRRALVIDFPEEITTSSARGGKGDPGFPSDADSC